MSSAATVCSSCGKPVEGEWCPEPCHTDLRDSNNRVTCRRKQGVCNCPDCCGARRSRATDPSLSDIPLHIRIADDAQTPSAASPSPRCACVNVCGDVPEASDHQNAHCRGLPVQPEKLVELVTVPRV